MTTLPTTMRSTSRAIVRMRRHRTTPLPTDTACRPHRPAPRTWQPPRTMLPAAPGGWGLATRKEDCPCTCSSLPPPPPPAGVALGGKPACGGGGGGRVGVEGGGEAAPRGSEYRRFRLGRLRLLCLG